METSDEDLINSCRLSLIELMTYLPDTFSMEDIRYVSKNLPVHKVIRAIDTFGLEAELILKRHKEDNELCKKN
jgi:hypothetical protein